jgi:ABC-type uncharacterized transport system permease subunit
MMLIIIILAKVTSMLFKILLVMVFVLVMISLSSGMVFLVKDKGQSKRTVRSLTYRIGLSVFTFGLLMLGYFAGWIEPHGVVP